MLLHRSGRVPILLSISSDGLFDYRVINHHRILSRFTPKSDRGTSTVGVYWKTVDCRDIRRNWTKIVD